MILEIPYAKAMNGSYDLPPSPDLFLVSLFLSYASGKKVIISPVNDTPLMCSYKRLFTDTATLQFEGIESEGLEPGYCVTPVAPADSASPAFMLPDVATLVYGDFIVFLLLGMGKTVTMPLISEKLLNRWLSIGHVCGCRIIQTADAATISLVLTQIEAFAPPDQALEVTMVHAVLGLICALRKQCSFHIDYHLQTPFRSIVTLFDITLTVKNAVEQKKEDPLSRRIRLMAARQKKKNEVAFSYIVTCSFPAGQPQTPAIIQLPGDDILASLLLTAKSLIPKGQLILRNMCVEQWSCATFSHMRKMGCNAAISPHGETAFGAVAMVSIQKYTLNGRKISCIPLSFYQYQLPAMSVLAQFASGQTVFRDCEDLRMNIPDTIEQYLACLKHMNVRFGEMPDGFVIDGTRDYDGFDIPKPYPAHMSAACAIAGLKCHGKTTIEASLLLARWPHFFDTLNTLCQYRTSL